MIRVCMATIGTNPATQQAEHDQSVAVCNYQSVFFRPLVVRILTDTYVSYLFKERNKNG